MTWTAISIRIVLWTVLVVCGSSSAVELVRAIRDAWRREDGCDGA